MQKQFFITATDTDAGKTYFSCVLTHALVKAKHKVAVYKPVAAGCDEATDLQGNKILINQDALLLQQAANCQQTLSQVNPIAFKAPIAPHIAAKKCQQSISLTQIEQGFELVKQQNSDVVICEGAGGWRLPLGNRQFLSDFVKQTKQQVILVVNIKLGCLNHALLTYESIINDGLDCVAWVANYGDADKSEQTADNNHQLGLSYVDDNIAELKTLLPIPLLAKLPYQQDFTVAAKQIDLSLLV
jgi:dethiobiotin synthetase